MDEAAQPVLQILDAYKASVYARDVEGLIRLYDADVCIFDLWGKWSYTGTSAWQKIVGDWLGSLGSERVIVDFAEPSAVVSNDLAVVRAFIGYQSVSSAGAALRSMQNRLTWVLRQRDGQWKIVHEHTSAPVDLDTMKVILQRD
jgi:ketosteroid isomerase-like protein